MSVRILRGEMVGETPAAATDVDVLFEIHTPEFSPAYDPFNDGNISVSVGSLNDGRGLNRSVSASEAAYIVSAAAMGDGYFEARVRPDTTWIPTGSSQMSILIETKDASGAKGDDPKRYNPPTQTHTHPSIHPQRNQALRRRAGRAPTAARAQRSPTASLRGTPTRSARSRATR